MDPLKYFAHFKYVPTWEEYQRFYPRRNVPKTGYSLKMGRVVSRLNERYLTGTLKRKKISEGKLKRRRWLVELMGRLPWVRYVGVSGTVSMLNAAEADDIDLFIITAAGRLWTARFFCIVLASIFGMRRRPEDKEFRDKLCLNLFFSEDDLSIPKFKRTEYVAHEMLQLMTIVNKDSTLERFIGTNKWVFGFFPNADKDLRIKNQKTKAKENAVEKVLKKWQLHLIDRRRTREIVTGTQLWFFPEDYEQNAPR